jgi:S1-C subfamily serine protease
MRFVLALAGALLLACSAHAAPFDASSAVEVSDDSGHGSGVYIGHGYVLTAAHVVAGKSEMTIRRNRSADWVDTWTAAVVWTDAVKDFALLKIRAVMPDEDMRPAKVSCEKPTLGQPLTIVGWPADLGQVQSVGYIGSEEAKRGAWPVSYVVVAPLFFGNSGGPVYAADGKVIGLAVGLVSGTSLALMVPTSTVCEALPAAVAVK